MNKLEDFMFSTKCLTRCLIIKLVMLQRCIGIFYIYVIICTKANINYLIMFCVGYKVIHTFSCETAKLEVADVANPLRISFRNGNLI